MEAVVEFHAFTDDSNRYIIKEFAVVSKSFQCQVIFAPPYKRKVLSHKAQRRARWLESKFHKISWEEGEIAYDLETVRDLCKPFSKLYTKGFEKAKFLLEFHPNVEEISFEPDDCDNNSVCVLPQHGKDNVARCAFRSALQYYRGMNKENVQKTYAHFVGDLCQRRI